MFELDWVETLLSAKVYVEMVAESTLGWTINVLIYVISALLAGRIIYVAFGGRNSMSSSRQFKTVQQTQTVRRRK